MKTTNMSVFRPSTYGKSIKVNEDIRRILDVNLNGVNNDNIMKSLKKLFIGYYKDYDTFEDFMEKVLSADWVIKNYNELLPNKVFSTKLQGYSRVVNIDKFPEDSVFAIVDVKQDIVKASNVNLEKSYVYKLIANSNLIGRSEELDIFVNGIEIVAITPNNSGSLVFDGCLINDKRIVPRKIDKSTAINYGFKEVICVANDNLISMDTDKNESVKLRVKLRESFIGISEETALGIRLKRMVKNKYPNQYPTYKSFNEIKHALLLSELTLVKTQKDLSVLTSSISGVCNVHTLSSLKSSDILMLVEDTETKGKLPMKKLYVINRKANENVKTCLLLKNLESEPKIMSIDIGGLYETNSREVLLADSIISIPVARRLGFSCAINRNISIDSDDYKRITLLKALVANKTIIEEFFNTHLVDEFSLNEFYTKLNQATYRIYEAQSIYFECDINNMLADYIPLEDLENNKIVELRNFSKRVGRTLVVDNVNKPITDKLTIKVNKHGDAYKITDIYAGNYSDNCRVKTDKNIFSVEEARNLGFTHAYIES